MPAPSITNRTGTNPAIIAANIAVLLPARKGGKTAAQRMIFDRALHIVAPRLTRRQRECLAAIGGFRQADAFDIAVIEPLEAQGLVRWADSGWKRHVGRKRQMSSSYRLTEPGRMFVISAARLISPLGPDEDKSAATAQGGATA